MGYLNNTFYDSHLNGERVDSKEKNNFYLNHSFKNFDEIGAMVFWDNLNFQDMDEIIKEHCDRDFTNAFFDQLTEAFFLLFKDQMKIAKKIKKENKELKERLNRTNYLL